MSEAKAKLSFARISPRKVNVVCALIRGKDIEMATAILQHTPKAASEYLIKLVKSAAANAENNHGMDPSKLYVSAAYADAGMIIKPYAPPCAWPRLSHQQKNFSHHHRGEREGVRR